MIDHSAEWMAHLRASGQLWPADQGQEVKENAEDLGLGCHALTKDGQQEPGDLLSRTRLFLSRLRLWLSPRWPDLPDDIAQSIDEQATERTRWIREHSRWEQP